MTATEKANTLWPVAIGTAARLSNISAKMVRHYESLSLLTSVARTDSGYRQYNQADVRTLQFIKRARDMGFSMAEISELVSLWNNRSRSSASVKRSTGRSPGVSPACGQRATRVHGCQPCGNDANKREAATGIWPVVATITGAPPAFDGPATLAFQSSTMPAGALTRHASSRRSLL